MKLHCVSLRVSQTIAALLPQTVLLELCPSRAGLLTLNEEELMRVAAALDTRRSLELIRRVRSRLSSSSTLERRGGPD